MMFTPKSDTSMSNPSNHYPSRSNPLPISDLYSANHNNDEAILPVFEEPVNYYSHIQKLINRTKNVEMEIEKSRNHSEFLFNEFFRLLQTTEMVAFDIMYIDCLFGAVEFNAFYDFIERCKGVKFSVFHPTESDIKHAADHIRYLHSIIQTSANDLQGYDGRMRLDPLQRPHKVYDYLNRLTSSIDSQIKNTQIREQTQPPTVEFDFGQDDSDNDEQNPTKIEEWIREFIKPNMDSNDELSQNRILFGRLLHHLNIVNNLKEETKNLQKSIILPRYTSALDLDPQAIFNSPFYSSTIGNSAFLRMAVDKFLSAQPQIDECEGIIEENFNHFSSLFQKCQETKKAAEEIQEQFKKRIAEKHKQMKEGLNEISPYHDLLLNDQKLEQIFKSIEDVTKLDSDLTAILEQPPNESGSSASEEVNNELLSVLVPLREMQKILLDLCKECADERTDDAKVQKMLFNLVAEVQAHDTKLYLFKREVEVLNSYGDALDEVYKNFQKEAIDKWCSKANEALDEIQFIINERNILQNQSETDINEEEIKELEMEIEKMERELSEINNEKIQLMEEVEEKKEQLFNQIQLNDIYIIYQDANLQRTNQLREFKEGITCPACKENLCEAIINKKSCCHAFCKQCLESGEGSKEGSCPICGTKYTKEHIQPFLFIPSERKKHS
ncbi:hypothetical protein TRFO_33424 [Tritrichomonas foetus]|uniref:E3 ubiquitin protein ligase n=1 Tax=Tritrichomonas foetus TaxID=1144522 RepID=A0A1J4JRZ1_9EUKA|nr:hypothetical protein TRFO_33424 [Tritrichomonas foetus]|eukprot:OHT00005.1 hypothetical protein TRFO_33424 [Tritrichomonas foetus]